METFDNTYRPAYRVANNFFSNYKVLLGIFNTRQSQHYAICKAPHTQELQCIVGLEDNQAVVRRTAWPEEEVQCKGHQGLHIVEGSQEVLPHRLEGPLHTPGAGHHKRVVGLHNLREDKREDVW